MCWGDKEQGYDPQPSAPRAPGNGAEEATQGREVEAAKRSNCLQTILKLAGATVAITSAIVIAARTIVNNRTPISTPA